MESGWWCSMLCLLASQPHLPPSPAPPCRSTTNADALPPLATAAELCHSLRSSPALRDLLLVARPGHVHGVSETVPPSPCPPGRCPCHATRAWPPPTGRPPLSIHPKQAMKLVLEIMLSLRGLRPDLSVRPIEHTGALRRRRRRGGDARCVRLLPGSCCAPAVAAAAAPLPASTAHTAPAAAATSLTPPADFFVEEPSPDKDEEAAAAAADPTPMLP